MCSNRRQLSLNTKKTKTLASWIQLELASAPLNHWIVKKPQTAAECRTAQCPTTPSIDTCSFLKGRDYFSWLCDDGMHVRWQGQLAIKRGEKFLFYLPILFSKYELMRPSNVKPTLTFDIVYVDTNFKMCTRMDLCFMILRWWNKCQMARAIVDKKGVKIFIIFSIFPVHKVVNASL